MNPAIEAAASKILRSMQRTYGRPPTRTRVDEAAFRHLDLRVYRRLRSELESAGFSFVQDFALTEINESPTTMIAPTMIRCLVSDDGRIVASYYQVKPRWGRLWGKVFTGVKNGRWIAAPRLLFRFGGVRHNVEFSSETSTGRFFSSSNAAAAQNIGMPTELDRRFHKTNTPWPQMLAEHRGRLAAATADGETATTTRGIDELGARFDRENVLKRAHRERIGWITRDELLKMSGGNAGMADAIHAAIRMRLGASASVLGGATDGEFTQQQGGDAAND